MVYRTYDIKKVDGTLIATVNSPEPIASIMFVAEENSNASERMVHAALNTNGNSIFTFKTKSNAALIFEEQTHG